MIKMFLKSKQNELLCYIGSMLLFVTVLFLYDVRTDAIQYGLLLSTEKYSLDAIVRQVIRKYSQMFILRKIHLQYAKTSQCIVTDEKWLQFVLEQVLSNALKYTKDGGMIFIYTEEKENKKCLVIEDSGIGIQAEDLPRVFEKGFTGYNGRADKKSTGIGLYMCKKIMERLNHQIWIESEIDKGTKVYLDLAREEWTIE